MNFSYIQIKQMGYHGVFAQEVLELALGDAHYGAPLPMQVADIC